MTRNVDIVLIYSFYFKFFYMTNSLCNEIRRRKIYQPIVCIFIMITSEICNCMKMIILSCKFPSVFNKLKVYELSQINKLSFGIYVKILFGDNHNFLGWHGLTIPNKFCISFQNASFYISEFSGCVCSFFRDNCALYGRVISYLSALESSSVLTFLTYCTLLYCTLLYS